MDFTASEKDVFVEDSSSDDKTVESLKEHRKQIKRRKKKQETVEPSLSRDLLGWGAIVASIAWLLMLISYDPTDPSGLNQTSKMIPDNYLGLVGANISDYCFNFLGFGNYALPLAAIYVGYLCIRTRKVNDWFFQVMGGGTGIFVFVIFLGSFSSVTYRTREIHPGGWLGVELWRFFTGYLNPVGTYLFLLFITGLAVLVTTQFTLRQIGDVLLKGFRWVGRGLIFTYESLMRKWESHNEDRTKRKIAIRELQKMEDSKEQSSQSAAARFKNRLGGSDDAKLLGDDTPKGEVPIHIRTRSVDLDDDGYAADVPLIHDSLDLDRHPTGPVVEDEPAEPAPLARPPRSNQKPTSDPVPVPPSDFVEEAAGDDDIKVNPLKQVKTATQEAFQFVSEMKSEWVYPSTYHFNKPNSENQIDVDELREKAHSLEEKCAEFKVTGEMKEIHPGPVVTTYEFKPDAGIKYSKVVNLSDDLCLALGAESVRIDRMPGKSSIGIEVPNNKREIITFREMVEAEEVQKQKSKLLLILGKTIDGTPYAADLGKAPHLLIAGQTGSGKSVGINAMLCSILMRNSPEETKMILIDPKMVEMGIYADIPHLLTPVVTDPQEASNALRWAVEEMERRYRLLAKYSHRNLEMFNKAIRNETIQFDPADEGMKPLPFIVVVIDEMADLMMVARGEVEESIARLAQKSRAIGIHLVLATQRPSVDIITGVIKSNLPSRLAYRVAQRNDSRIILDANGADQLLGKGDGLFLGPGTSRLVRIHAPFISEAEVLDLVKFLKNQGQPDYDHSVVKHRAPAEDEEEEDKKKKKGNKKAKKPAGDEAYEKAARLVVRTGQASVSYLQRKMGLGYARAAKLVDMMEEDGIVGPSQGSKAREILVSNDFFDEIDRARMD